MLNTGIEQVARNEIAQGLSAVLDHTYALLVRSHIYHWNVHGPLFEPLHELLEVHYKALFEATDEIAERIRQLGCRAPANLSATFPTGVQPQDLERDARGMVEDLLDHHERSCREMRQLGIAADDAGDLVTADMLSEFLAFHEKAAWMLRAMLDGWARPSS